MFKIKTFIIGTINNDRGTIHEGETNDLTHGRTRNKRKETNGRGAKKRQRFSKIVLEVGERKMRGEWKIMYC